MDFDSPGENRSFSPNRYFDRHLVCEVVKILPGEYYATTDETFIVTVLGSCVAVCLRDPVRNIGGMNHFLLPSDNSASISSISESARYGVYAMELLINQMLKLGADKRRLQAKVFGGGNVLSGFTVNNVGERNAEFVLDYLAAERIAVLASDLLDIYPRKVYFSPHSGQVKVRKIKSLHNTTIMDRESEYRMRIRHSAKGGDVELFNE
ncbi:MAG: chemotaxis protein CheD [Paraglaciecola sp.]|jgi:chemotaxis protein CheD